MPAQLTLHIGTPKSGTTHLQSILLPAREALRRRGVLYPGERYLPHDGFNQQPAIYALGRRHIGWVTEDARANAGRYYDQLCREVSAHERRVLISAESLAFFDPAEIRELLRGLGGDTGSVDVVITARDLGRLLPSIWQQNVKNGTSMPFEDYLESVASLRGRPNMPLWTAFGLPGLVARWAEVVGQEHVVLVTAPHRGRSTLWKRFAVAADLPESLPDQSGSGSRSDRNLSLTQSQTDLLRHLNVHLDAKGYAVARQQVLRAGLLKAWMSTERSTAPPIALPGRFRTLVEQWSDEDVEALRDLGVRVVGSLDDLRPASTTVPAVRADHDPLAHVAQDLLLLLEHHADAEAIAATPRARNLRRLLRRLAVRRSPARDISLRDVATPAPVTVDLSDDGVRHPR